MTQLIVDISSLPDLLEGLRQIQIEIRRVYDNELPIGSTAEFADELWERIAGSELEAVVDSLAKLSKRQEYFTPNESFDVIRATGLSPNLLVDLTAIELELGVRLVGEHWIQDHLTSCCWVHPVARERLLALTSRLSLAAP
jgi:hypothetical protein